MAPLTGVAFVVILIIAFAIGGWPEPADSSVDSIVNFYVDNKDSIVVGSFLSVLAGLMLIVFGAFLRRLLHDAGGEGEILSLVSFAGLVTVAIGLAIDGTILLAAAESAEDIDPAAVQALQALYDNDYLPIALGVAAFLWGTGLSAMQSGALPKWLAGLMILLGVIAFTPIGFVAAIGAGLLVLVLGVMLTMRMRSATDVSGAAPSSPRRPEA